MQAASIRLSLMALASVLASCSSGSSGISSTTDASTNSAATNPFTMPFVASTVPTDGATNADPFQGITLNLNYGVNIPFTLDNRDFMLDIVSLQWLDSSGNVVRAGNPIINQPGTQILLEPNDELQCGAQYHVSVDLKARESYDEGGSYADPKFGGAEQSMTITYTTGAPPGGC